MHKVLSGIYQAKFIASSGYDMYLHPKVTPFTSKQDKELPHQQEIILTCNFIASSSEISPKMTSFQLTSGTGLLGGPKTADTCCIRNNGQVLMRKY